MAELGTPNTNNQFISLFGDTVDDSQVTVVKRLKPADIKCTFHVLLPATMVAILAANAPATNPASIFTTVSTEQD